MQLAIVGFILMVVLMVVLIKEKLSPPIAFILLPVIAAAVAGFSAEEIGGFVGTGMKTMLSTAVLFVFSISYFTLMSEEGLFDPIINFLIKSIGKSVTTVLFAIVLVTFVAHLDGSGATTFLIVVPAFLPICKKLKVRPEALLATMCGMYAVMNIVPWGGPTMRAASVAEIEVSELYNFILPGVVVLAVMAFVNALVVARIEKKHGACIPDGGLLQAEVADEKENAQAKRSKGRYFFNLGLTVVMLVFLFVDIGLPLYFIFMVAFSIALAVNYPSVKEQTKKIKSYAGNAMVMTMTLFSVGVFMGVIKDSGMVEAMANALVSILPSFLTPHLHWFLALFAVPLLMILGTDAFYYALLPIIISVVSQFGISPETVAATFLLTATYGTPISPSVAAVYVGLGLTDVSIGNHIKYSLRLMWPASIVVLVVSTLLGVIKF
jgi:CitMHS family citrate-Mg2+:H+ or citrate-Ca2+:H+ symporter